MDSFYVVGAMLKNICDLQKKLRSVAIKRPIWTTTEQPDLLGVRVI
jgi:hypothetical protein